MISYVFSSSWFKVCFLSLNNFNNLLYSSLYLVLFKINKFSLVLKLFINLVKLTTDPFIVFLFKLIVSLFIWLANSLKLLLKVCNLSIYKFREFDFVSLYASIKLLSRESVMNILLIFSISFKYVVIFSIYESFIFFKCISVIEFTTLLKFVLEGFVIKSFLYLL